MQAQAVLKIYPEIENFALFFLNIGFASWKVVMKELIVHTLFKHDHS